MMSLAGHDVVSALGVVFVLLLRHSATTDALWLTEAAVYGGDYCDTETFRAECARDEVVVMRSARYGRMTLGRCVETEMGHIGCYRDVLTPVDRRCSGRHRCELRIPDAELESTRPCLRELKSYLEAAYSCVPVINRTAEFCRRHSELRMSMTSRTGSKYVASLMTSDSPACARSPWSVEASPGQHINITLWDFTTVDDRRLSASSSLYGSAAARRPPPPVSRPRNADPATSSDAAALFVETGVTCRKYAVVQDGARQLTLCGGSRRLAGSYVSRDSGVKVWMIAGVAPTDRQRFLLQFTVVGCADLASPEIWFRRHTSDHATVGCRDSTVSWTVRCYGQTWTGPSHNCSTSTGNLLERRVQLPPRTSSQLLFSVVAVFAVSAALVVTLILLAVTRQCRRREHRRKKRSKSSDAADADKTAQDSTEQHDDVNVTSTPACQRLINHDDDEEDLPDDSRTSSYGRRQAPPRCGDAAGWRDGQLLPPPPPPPSRGLLPAASRCEFIETSF